MIGCSTEDHFSVDRDNLALLPDQKDYLETDYGTQEIANEIGGVYHSSIGLVVYDEETRTKPVLYLTRGTTEITIKPLESGAVEISYQNFSTNIMPLRMSLTIKGLLEKRNDTIFIRGADGKVRTKPNKEMPIGTPLPESDDAAFERAYITKDKKMGMLIDLMLPIPVKALVRAQKLD